MTDAKTIARSVQPRQVLGWVGFGLLAALLATALVAARGDAQANHGLQGLVLALIR